VQQELLRDPREAGQPPRVEQVAVSQTANTGEQMAMRFDDGAQAFIGTCPDCGSQLEYAEGCVKCHVCGFSECG
jgi:ribonucleoside-diphosphate reductase alpha chain